MDGKQNHRKECGDQSSSGARMSGKRIHFGFPVLLEIMALTIGPKSGGC
jgi:hypothetical protein